MINIGGLELFQKCNSSVLFKLLLSVTILSTTACSSVGIKSSDVQLMHYGQNANELKAFNDNNHIYRLDYLVGTTKFRYETYLLTDTGEYCEFLFKDRKLAGITKIQRTSAEWPEIRNCTLFPANHKLNVVECFNNTNKKILQNSISLSNEILSVVNRESLDELRKESQERAFGTVYAVLYFASAAVVVVPMVSYAEMTNHLTRKNFEIRLGDKLGDLNKYISLQPEKTRDIRDGNGSVFVEGAFSHPVIALGIYDDTVVWINMNPNTRCEKKGGFWSDRNCRILRNDEKPAPKKQKTAALSSEEKESLSDSP